MSQLPIELFAVDRPQLARQSETVQAMKSKALFAGCARNCAAPEAVGPPGIVVSPFDERAIAETIIGWARSDLERQKWCDRARAQAAEFSWRESVEKPVGFMKSRVPVSSD
jgi:glycosyltransferase involved in cell wall biosynthesis